MAYIDIETKPTENIQTKIKLDDSGAPYDLFGFNEAINLSKILGNRHSSNESDSLKDVTKIKSETFDSYASQNFDTHIPFLNVWKNTENVSARLIEFYDDIVVLECLVDKENWIYEEREFPASLFEEFSLQIGKLFLLRVLNRPSQSKIEIHDNPNLTSQSDFPKLDFKEVFKDFVLFRK